MSFQDKHSTGQWSSVHHKDLLRPTSESIQSYYCPDHRKYSSTVDNYEPLSKYQGNQDFKIQPYKSTELYASKIKKLHQFIGSRKKLKANRELKDQFFEPIKVPQEPFNNDNYGLNSLSNLISSPHDWKNIQEVVRIAFKYAADSFYTQQNQIKYLLTEMQNKASKNELNTKMSSKEMINKQASFLYFSLNYIILKF